MEQYFTYSGSTESNVVFTRVINTKSMEPFRLTPGSLRSRDHCRSAWGHAPNKQCRTPSYDYWPNCRLWVPPEMTSSYWIINANITRAQTITTKFSESAHHQFYVENKNLKVCIIKCSQRVSLLSRPSVNLSFLVFQLTRSSIDPSHLLGNHALYDSLYTGHSLIDRAAMVVKWAYNFVTDYGELIFCAFHSVIENTKCTLVTL